MYVLLTNSLFFYKQNIALLYCFKEVKIVKIIEVIISKNVG
jgi:hypothetical protein